MKISRATLPPEHLLLSVQLKTGGCWEATLGVGVNVATGTFLGEGGGGQRCHGNVSEEVRVGSPRSLVLRAVFECHCPK